MKGIVFSAAIIASAICVSAQAQQVSSVQTSNKQQVEVAAQSQTILNGNWSISTDDNGKLSITDQDKKVVRVFEGKAGDAQASVAALFSTASAYPFKLSVDKQGNLHIQDNTAYVSSANLQPMVLVTDNNGFGDPDRQVPVKSAHVGFVGVVKK